MRESATEKTFHAGAEESKTHARHEKASHFPQYFRKTS